MEALPARGGGGTKKTCKCGGGGAGFNLRLGGAGNSGKKDWEKKKSGGSDGKKKDQ